MLPILLFLLEEDWPQANICANLPGIFCVCGLPAQNKLMSGVGLHPGSEPANLGYQRGARRTLTTMLLGQLLFIL